MSSGALMLLGAALIWGTAFVAQSLSMGYIGSFTFNGIRMLLGALSLMPLIILRKRSHAPSMGQGADGKKNLILGSIICGTFLCIATNFQQIGLAYTTVGKAGFITAMYIVFVPVIYQVLGKKAGRKIWAAVVLAVVGLYLLSMQEGITLSMGDGLELACAVFFACQIIAVDRFASLADGIQLSAGEFIVCGLESLLMMCFFEHPSMAAISAAKWSILYTGILSSGVAYTLQILGQKKLEPAKASLIMSLESPISALSGWLILQQAMSARELLGCVFMFAAIIISQRGEN